MSEIHHRLGIPTRLGILVELKDVLAPPSARHPCRPKGRRNTTLSSAPMQSRGASHHHHSSTPLSSRGMSQHHPRLGTLAEPDHHPRLGTPADSRDIATPPSAQHPCQAEGRFITTLGSVPLSSQGMSRHHLRLDTPAKPRDVSTPPSARHPCQAGCGLPQPASEMIIRSNYLNHAPNLTPRLLNPQKLRTDIAILRPIPNGTHRISINIAQTSEKSTPPFGALESASEERGAECEDRVCRPDKKIHLLCRSGRSEIILPTYIVFTQVHRHDLGDLVAFMGLDAWPPEHPTYDLKGIIKLALSEDAGDLADPSLKVEWCKNDGDFVHKGLQFRKVQGLAYTIVVAERLVLNFMQQIQSSHLNQDAI
ncbi:hypothetical protein Fmac_029294 [Flemingia macrophylla]|uniref:Quinolinate phosphoribosyl transferase N-terminal domain-containing protein n=1 Tax=Flemingia macrophylla TaxID=520843 RepID=A0ABD1L9X5_9FABA